MKNARVEMLAIGDEILDGRVVDTNSVRAALALGQVGLHIKQRTTITDDIEIIVREAQNIARRGATLCIVSGGLGPTADDLTAEAMAALVGQPLLRDAAQAAKITAYLEGRGRTVGENQLTQADRPQGGTVIENPVGTAPGFEVSFEGCRFVCVPGVPREFDTLLAQAVIEPLRGVQKPLLRRALYTFGMMEADVDRKLSAHRARFPKVRLQFQVKFPEVHVTMHAAPEDSDVLDLAAEAAQEALGDCVYSTKYSSLVETTLALLQKKKLRLAVAESCTGGLITDLLTDISGASDILDVGVTAYDNQAKVRFLGVDPETISRHGAVSDTTAKEMAEGARKLVGSDIGIAVSGIAGPGGGTAKKPVGTLWFGLSTDQETRAHRLNLPHDRRGNKVVGAYTALNMVRCAALNLPTELG